MAINFYFFNHPEQPFAGVAASGQWNGFDNVRVTPAVAREIDAFFEEEGAEGEHDALSEIAPDADGLIDLSNGYATVILADGAEPPRDECVQHRDSGRGVCVDCGAFLPSAEGRYWDSH